MGGDWAAAGKDGQGAEAEPGAPVGQEVPEQPPGSDRQRPPEVETWRLFVAIDLPRHVKEEIAGMVDSMPQHAKPLVRWGPREGIHLTLQFLGDVEPGRVPEITEKLTDAASRTGRFSVSLSKPGAFPSYRDAKILWVGFEGEVRRLAQLHGRVVGALSTLGFEAERRPFVPHATVGRVARDVRGREAGDVGYGWRNTRRSRHQTDVPVESITLFRSHLMPGGPRYEPVFTAPLG